MSALEPFPNLPTDNRPTKIRCVNLDWLEVHCREPITLKLDADYFRANGVWVEERGYGTRIYREMFTILGTDGQPYCEVRRNPASQGLHGIHDPNECHLRLVNRSCYFDNAASSFKEFLERWGYYDIRISRVDVCLDFAVFDKGDDPAAFVRRYFRHKYAKINQGNISSHGKDGWDGQEWNSLAWGSKTSAVSTKMYDKTMELYNPKDASYKKPWIRHAWLLCGLVDDMTHCTLNGTTQRIWRVEFSLSSAVKNWVPLELDGKDKNYYSIPNTLDCYESRDRILTMFASLAQHYFRFKKYKEGQRKDRCPDKILFDFSDMQTTYKIGRPDYTVGNSLTIKEKYERLIQKIRDYSSSKSEMEIHKAASTLIEAMESDNIRYDLANPFDNDELRMIRFIMNQKSRNPELDVNVLMKEAKELLRISSRVLPF